MYIWLPKERNLSEIWNIVFMRMNTSYTNDSTTFFLA